MVPIPHPAHGAARSSVHFVPVDGRTVFVFCVLLIAANLWWLGMLVSKGWERFEADE